MEYEVFLCVGSTCNSAFCGVPIVLLAQRWSVDVGVLLARLQYIPIHCLLTPYTEQLGLLCQWGYLPVRALNNDRLPILMESSELLSSNWSLRCKDSRNGWASDVHGGCVLNLCGLCAGTHRLWSNNTCVGVRARVAATRGLTTNRPPLTKSHPFEWVQRGHLFNAKEGRLNGASPFSCHCCSLRPRLTLLPRYAWTMEGSEDCCPSLCSGTSCLRANKGLEVDWESWHERECFLLEDWSGPCHVRPILLA